MSYSPLKFLTTILSICAILLTMFSFDQATAAPTLVNREATLAKHQSLAPTDTSLASEDTVFEPGLGGGEIITPPAGYPKCQFGTATTTGRNYRGNALYTTTIDGYWCWKPNGEMMSAQVTHHESTVHAPGWVATALNHEAAVSTSTNQALMLVRYRYSYQYKGVTYYSKTQCLRLVGKVGGAFSRDHSCSSR